MAQHFCTSKLSLCTSFVSDPRSPDPVIFLMTDNRSDRTSEDVSFDHDTMAMQGPSQKLREPYKSTGLIPRPFNQCMQW